MLFYLLFVFFNYLLISFAVLVSRALAPGSSIPSTVPLSSAANVDLYSAPLPSYKPSNRPGSLKKRIAK